MCSVNNTTNNEQPILIYHQNNKYFIWNADDVVTLRTKHRICGSLIGSLVRKPWQSNISSLPLLLLIEEVHFCLYHKISKIIDSKDFFEKKRFQANANEFYEARNKREREQIEIFITEKSRKQTSLYGSNKGKRKKKEKRQTETENEHEKVKEESKTVDCRSEIVHGNEIENHKIKHVNEVDFQSFCSWADETPEQDSESKDKISKDRIIKSSSASIEMDQEETIDVIPINSSLNQEQNVSLETNDNLVKNPSSHTICLLKKKNESSDEQPDNLSESEPAKPIKNEIIITEQAYKYYKPNIRVHIPTSFASSDLNIDHKVDNLQNSLEIEILKPLDENQKAKNMIFKDLWAKNYYMTSAEKFGGDFLVYPGDPLRHHSFFIVIYMKNDSRLSTKEIICYGRLSASVKKTVVLARLDKDENVKYISLNWSHT